jgi:hypothetical protein
MGDVFFSVSQLVASVDTGSVVLAKAARPVFAVGGSSYLSPPEGAAHVPQQLADDLFTALGRGAEETAELAILSSGTEQAMGQALNAQASGVSVRASLDNLLWESDDSSWQDGKHEWLP